MHLHFEIHEIIGQEKDCLHLNLWMDVVNFYSADTTIQMRYMMFYDWRYIIQSANSDVL